jgi:Gram-negative bacterial TonB protein C-terminal
MRSLLFSCIGCALATAIAAGQEAPVEPQQMLKLPAQVMAARLLTAVTPDSPKMRKCSNAMVTLDVVVGEDGKVTILKVLGGFEEFTRSAIPAVKQWIYRPYLETKRPFQLRRRSWCFFPMSGSLVLFSFQTVKEGLKEETSCPCLRNAGLLPTLNRRHRNSRLRHLC